MYSPVVEAFGGGESLDRSAGGKTSNSQIKMTVTGNLSIVTTDQTPFFNQDADVAISANHSLRTPVPAVAPFTAQTAATFIAFNMMPLRNINVVNALTAAVVSSMQLQFVRNTPMGQSQGDTIFASGYLTAQDFQTTRVQIPVDGEVLDGYSFLRLLNTSTNPAATYDVIFTFGGRIGRRIEVPTAGGAVLVSPGARR